jgi:hypothetical protein
MPANDTPSIREDLLDDIPVTIVGGEDSSHFFIDQNGKDEIVFNPDKAAEEILKVAEMSASDYKFGIGPDATAFIADNEHLYKEHGPLAVIHDGRGYQLFASAEVIAAIYADMSAQGMHFEVAEARNNSQLSYFVEMLMISDPNKMWEDYERFGGPSATELRNSIAPLLEIARRTGVRSINQQAALNHEKNHARDLRVGTNARAAHLNYLEFITTLAHSPSSYRESDLVKGALTCNYQRRALFEAKSFLVELEHATLGDGTDFAWNLFASRLLDLTGQLKKDPNDGINKLEKAVYKNLNLQSIESGYFSAHSMGVAIILFGPDALDEKRGYLNFEKVLGENYEPNEPGLNAARVAAMIANKIVNFTHDYATGVPPIDRSPEFKDKLSRCIEELSRIETQYFKAEYLKD